MSQMKKLSLDDLRKSEKAGSVVSLGFAPNGDTSAIRGMCDDSVPEDLIEAWIALRNAKIQLGEMLTKYNFPE